MAEYGAQEHFLTREKLLFFRGLTGLLAMTNGIDNKPTKTNIYKGDDPNDRKFVLASYFTNLLVRQHEVAAVTVNDLSDKLCCAFTSSNEMPEQPVSETDLLVADSHVSLVATQNFRRHDNPDVPENETVTPSLSCKVASNLVKDFPTTTAARYYLDNVVGYSKKTNTYETKISFPQHVTNIFSLLRQIRLAPEIPEVQVANERFQHYVLISSVDKIKARVSIGQRSKRRYLEKLEHDIEQNRPFLEDWKCNKKFNPLTEWQLSTLHSENGTLQFLEDRLPNDKALFSAARAQFTRQADGDWYNVASRYTFYGILRRLLYGFRSAVEKLTKFKNETNKKLGKLLKEKMTDSEREELVGEMEEGLEILADQLGLWQTHFSNFHVLFRLALEAHFEWLNEGFEAYELYPDHRDAHPIATGVAAGLETAAPAAPAPAVPVTPARALTQDDVSRAREGLKWASEPPLSKYQKGRPTNFSAAPDNASSDESGDEDVTRVPIIPTETLEEDDEALEMEEFDKTYKEDWPKSAAQYVDRLLVHAVALEALQRKRIEETNPERKQVSEFVTKAGLRIVEVKPDVKDAETEALDHVLREFKQFHKDRDWGLITGWLKKHRKIGTRASQGFTGTYHCEAVLLSLRHLQRLRDSGDLDILTTAENGVLLPSHDALKLFPKPVEVLTVTKHCCPACASLVKISSEVDSNQRETRLRFPGTHSAWTACSPPPWIPVDAGNEMIKVATEAFKSRLLLVLELAEKELSDESGASQGKRPTPPYSSEADVCNEVIMCDGVDERAVQKRTIWREFKGM